jgi:hypothetical protein
MATYAEFYDDGGYGALVPATGDRSVIRLDARHRQRANEELAERECRERGYVAWRIIRGASLLRAIPVTRIVSLYY